MSEKSALWWCIFTHFLQLVRTECFIRVNVLRSQRYHSLFYPRIEPVALPRRRTPFRRVTEAKGEQNQTETREKPLAKSKQPNGNEEQCRHSQKLLSDPSRSELDRLTYYALEIVKITPFRSRHYTEAGRTFYLAH